MIYMYNETNTPWTYSAITDRYARFTVAKKVDEMKTRYFNLASTTLAIENIESYVNMDSVDTIYSGTVGLLFQKRDCAPMVTTTTKYAKDILMMNIQLNGSVIKSINSTTMNVINYMIAKGELILVVSGDDNTDNTIEIVLHNNREKNVTTYVFTKNGNTYNVETYTEETGEILSSPNFKIYKFRPSRPTHAILVNDGDDGDYFDNNKLVQPDRHVIHYFNDENIGSVIDSLKKDKYNAVTLFVNKEELDNGEQLAHFPAIKKAFAVVNILLNNKKVIKK